MRFIISILFLLLSIYAFAQEEVNRKGFIFGLGLGVGHLSLNTNDTSTNNIAISLPNIKIGYMLRPNLALSLYFPGSTYKHGNKDRGFEAIMLNSQYWFAKNIYASAGIGLTFDAPAFYTVKDPKEAKFYTGFPALSLGAGYELFHKGRFTLDLQYRFFYGQSELDNNGTRKGTSNMLIIGFNWY